MRDRFKARTKKWGHSTAIIIPSNVCKLNKIIPGKTYNFIVSD